MPEIKLRDLLNELKIIKAQNELLEAQNKQIIHLNKMIFDQNQKLLNNGTEYVQDINTTKNTSQKELA